MQNFERYQNVIRTLRNARSELVNILEQEKDTNAILKDFAPKSEVNSLSEDGKIIYTQIRDLGIVIDNRITE